MGPDEFLKAASVASLLGLDTESTGLKIKDGTDHLTGVSLAYRGGPLYFSKYFPFFHKIGNNLPVSYLNKIQELIKTKPISVHNITHDIAAGKTRGLDLTVSPMIYDPMMECHFINEEEYSKRLDYLSKKYLGEEKYRDEITQWTNIFGWANVPSFLMEQYAAKDAELHLKLHEYFWPLLQEEELDALWPLEQEFLKLLSKMMSYGVKVNQVFCHEQIELGTKRMIEIENELGFIPSKSSELKPYLLDVLKLPILKVSTLTGEPSFNRNVMVEYEHMLEHRKNPSAKLVLEYRGWQKTISSFYKSILNFISEDGRVRANFKAHQARTTRLSAENPAIQCIPKESKQTWNGKAKEAFIPEEGFDLIEADYSQLEFRLEAEYSEEESLREAFSDPSRDVFNEMSKRIGMPRFETKTFKYATGYGAGPGRISAIFNITLEEAMEIRTQYRNSYPGIYRATTLAKQLAESRGFVRYWTGRRRHLSQYDSSKAFNSLMQGGGAEIVKRVMIRLDKEICEPSKGLIRIVLQVHDSIWFEIHKSLTAQVIPKIREIMTDLPQFKTPFAVDIHKVGG